jgi:hypothetical protein
MSRATKKAKLRSDTEASQASESVSLDDPVQPSDRIPGGFAPHRFGESIMGPDRAQDPRNELWLFQLPPELVSSDLVTTNVRIPTGTVVPHQAAFMAALAAGDEATAAAEAARIPAGHVRIGAFTVKGINYVLYETPARDAADVVNFWTGEAEEADEQGSLIRGKPFVRYLLVLPVCQSATEQFALGPIPDIPRGWNEGVGQMSPLAALAAGPAAAAVFQAGAAAAAAAGGRLAGTELKREKKEKKEKKDKAAFAAVKPEPAAEVATPAAPAAAAAAAPAATGTVDAEEARKVKKEKKEKKVKKEAE